MNVPQSIFVSYSQADRACAFELVARLESGGLPCWIAPRDVSPAADWAAEIIEAIAASRVMVLVFSASSNGSPQVRREVERAAHKNVRILPFRIEDVLPSQSLEYFLSTQHWLDAFPGPLEPHYLLLSRHLRTILAEAPLTAVPAPLPAREPMGPNGGHPAGELKHIEGVLAGFVGPIARHLVRHAAAQAPTVEKLVEVLSRELESDADRRSFGQLCRTPLSPRT